MAWSICSGESAFLHTGREKRRGEERRCVERGETNGPAGPPSPVVGATYLAVRNRCRWREGWICAVLKNQFTCYCYTCHVHAASERASMPCHVMTMHCILYPLSYRGVFSLLPAGPWHGMAWLGLPQALNGFSVFPARAPNERTDGWLNIGSAARCP